MWALPFCTCGTCCKYSRFTLIRNFSHNMVLTNLHICLKASWLICHRLHQIQWIGSLFFHCLFQIPHAGRRNIAWQSREWWQKYRNPVSPLHPPHTVLSLSTANLIWYQIFLKPLFNLISFNIYMVLKLYTIKMYLFALNRCNHPESIISTLTVITTTCSLETNSVAFW